MSQLREIISRQEKHPEDHGGVIMASELLNKDGNVIPVEMTVRIMIDEEKTPCGVQGITRDIRERHAMQTQLRQAQKMESIGTMASGIAHEVNNPIGVISACGQMLSMSTGLTTNEKEYVRSICDQAENIHQTVNNLLGFVRTEDEQEPSLFPADSPLEKSLQLVDTQLRHSHIHLKSHIQKPVPDLSAHLIQIQQLLLNLLINGIDTLNAKYPDEHEDKQIKITVSTEGEDMVHYTVEDHGEGMSLSKLENLFDPFFTTKPEGKGTGLGTWIIHQIVKNHRGYVLVESEEGKGTRFDIFLPRDFKKAVSRSRPTIQIVTPEKALSA